VDGWHEVVSISNCQPSQHIKWSHSVPAKSLWDRSRQGPKRWGLASQLSGNEANNWAWTI